MTRILLGLVCVAVVVTLGCAAAPSSGSERATHDSSSHDDLCPGQVVETIHGQASYYADSLHGRPTASGEPYDVGKLTAAHKSLPFQTQVCVVNLTNRQAVVVKINDRGPFVAGRIIDLSRAAAQRLDMITAGVAGVEVHILERP